MAKRGMRMAEGDTQIGQNIEDGAMSNGTKPGTADGAAADTQSEISLMTSNNDLRSTGIIGAANSNNNKSFNNQSLNNRRQLISIGAGKTDKNGDQTTNDIGKLHYYGLVNHP